MTFSMKRMYAIFLKDLKDLSKNMFITSSMLMPLLIAVLYSRMDELSIDMIYLVINLSFSTIGVFVQSAIIAEEKEKNTLRGLMLSPATILEIFGGKSLVTFLLTLLTIILSARLIDYEPSSISLIAIALIISSVFYIGLGTLMGLLTKSVVEASVITLPIIFLFGFSTLLQTLINTYPILSFIEYLPNVQLAELAKEVQLGAGIEDIWGYLAIILVWGIGIWLLTTWFYKKKETAG
ncbi:MAG: ABC transporter permease [Bacillota bacterium]|uniref:ABC transporter permease n=1 Tax=Virgibacillus salarius TaxID=447199 RepID=A0A941DX86_9BACI|nr:MULTISPECIES: ABC transporter permease [Bacillaceae]NAZ09876.1 ABC transporter permease [Agaribacter marinus]MBR7797167.1 ABC transporter permease [Virgibacillus salarius]MCC2251276.1 ABC transporter permease [Virgibacillus sp. AGTR]MDY7043837.1 ABC transporter permease [Virgibacillus sp. M23]QRZ19486.1 ABC transporter permease [Virgibacillus sp. AGTR]